MRKEVINADYIVMKHSLSFDGCIMKKQGRATSFIVYDPVSYRLFNT